MAHIQKLLRVWLGLLVVTIVACVPAVYVEPANSMTFAQAVEADAAIDARSKAHNVKERVRGDAPSKGVATLSPMRVPEAYTLDGSEGHRVSQYHLGYAAARLIREYYGEAYPHALRIKSDKLPDVIDAAGGNAGVIYEKLDDWPVELADIQRRVVFEVVPPGQTHRAAGRHKAELHLMFLNQAMLDVPKFKLGTGFAGEVGVRFAEDSPPWVLAFETVEPGVVQFRWHVLTVAKVTEESCREAYLAKRWRDVTLREMTLYGRSLHEVVERLVQAREEMGQTQARAEMPVAPGKTLVDYMETVVAWSAHDDKRAQFLPVMRGPPVEVTPPKQFVGQTLPGGAGGDAEGVYELKGKPGKQPDNLHMGNSAHILLGNRYKMLHPGELVFTNWVSISEIVKAATGTPRLLQRNEALLRPDIAHVSNERVVFEIKSRAPGRLVEGQVAVAKYLAAINRAMGPNEKFKPGTEYAGNFWVRFNKVMPWWRIEWDTTTPGVVQYKWQKLNNEEVDEPTILEGVKAGKYAWVDLTEGDMQQYGQECETFARKYTGGAQILYKTRVASSLLVELMGHAAIVYVSSGLAANSNAAPKGAAQATQSGPRVRVGVEPTPTTRGNAGPPPEPVGEPEVVPDVAARSKM